MTNDHKDNKTMAFPSSTDQVSQVDDFLESWLREKGIPEDTIADLAIAVTELVNNAIRHGNKLQKEKKVTVALSYYKDKIIVSVADEGEGFIPGNIPDPLAEENLLKEIGRGIFIVNSLIDDVKYQFPPEGGTKVVITKKIEQ